MKMISIIFKKQYIRILALLSVLVLALIPSEGFNFTLCPMQNIFGLPCPACGITRSMSSLLSLDILHSFQYHPLGIIVLAAIFTALFVNHSDFLYMRVFNKVSIYHSLILLFIITWLSRLVIFNH